MSYDDWKTSPPDDDPHGDDFALKLDDGSCHSCGARPDEDCTHDCKCNACERRRDAEEVA